MSDLIRREDAIDAVLELNTDGRVSWKDAVIDMLDALPSATCDDCIWHVCNYNKIDWDGEDGYISRQDAIDALGEEPPVWYDGEDEIAERNQWRRDKAAIESLPSAEPKTGEWINRSMNICYPEWERYTCSECGKHSYIYDYCPNCGARMKRVDDE